MKSALFPLLLACSLLPGAEKAKSGPATFAVEFEPEAHSLGAAKSPKFIARRAHGLLLLKTVPAPGGGSDLVFQSSNDVGDSWTEPLRVNNVPGEVSDHGENSPQLLFSPDEMTMYAVWGARDPKFPAGGVIRFSRSNTMSPAWSPAVTLNDDNLPVSHSFQSAAVGPDGAIYAAWLDGRDGRATTPGATAGTTSIYMTRSDDGGKTWSKNTRVSTSICPCCRVSWAFTTDRVLLAWRYVEAGDIRDIYSAASADKGATWSAPGPVFRDGWKIRGCPHVGPAMTALGGKVYITWFTEGANEPAVYLAVSSDGGRTFSQRRKLSEGTTDPTHPQITVSEGRLAVVFQARDAKVKGGWGKMGVYYRELREDGSISPLVRAAEGKAALTYPTAALGLSGRIFLGWTETSEGESKAYLLRGRAVN
jgi:hypothetical protein